MTVKLFTGFIILNWKTKRINIRKRKPGKKITPYDICISYNIEVDVPELKCVELKGKFTVPEIQVKQALIEEV
jgi:activator of HSP90 ATPase